MSIWRKLRYYAVIFCWKKPCPRCGGTSRVLVCSLRARLFRCLACGIKYDRKGNRYPWTSVGT